MIDRERRGKERDRDSNLLVFKSNDLLAFAMDGLAITESLPLQTVDVLRSMKFREETNNY